MSNVISSLSEYAPYLRKVFDKLRLTNKAPFGVGHPKVIELNNKRLIKSVK